MDSISIEVLVGGKYFLTYLTNLSSELKNNINNNGRAQNFGCTWYYSVILSTNFKNTVASYLG